MRPTTYNMARRAWAKPPGTGANWAQAGSLRGGVVRVARSPARDGSALQSSRMRWPTLLRSTSEGCARRPTDHDLYQRDRGKFHIRHLTMQSVIDGYVDPRWGEWLMGFGAGWTRRG